MSYKNLKRKQEELGLKEKGFSKHKKIDYSADADEWWSPKVDKAGTADVTLRLLPLTEKDIDVGLDTAVIELYEHGFDRTPENSDKKRWYINRSLTTFNCDIYKGTPFYESERIADPVGEYNSKLWESGEEGQKLVKGVDKLFAGSKRKHSYVVGVYIEDADKNNKDAIGGVYKWKIGPKLYEIITAPMNPKFEKDEKYDPFDLDEGASFNLRIAKNSNGHRDYSSSKFLNREPFLNGDEEEMEEVFSKIYPLSDELDQTNERKWASYDVLKGRLIFTVGKKHYEAVMEGTIEEDDGEQEDERPARRQPSKTQAKSRQTVDDDGEFNVNEDDDKSSKYADDSDDIPF